MDRLFEAQPYATSPANADDRRNSNDRRTKPDRREQEPRNANLRNQPLLSQAEIAALLNGAH